MKREKYITILFIIAFCLQAYGTILMRNSFEVFEGALNWNTSTAGNGIAQKLVEDTITFQKQRHGEWSLYIYDPNNTSYANAYKTFTNSASEYMTEFYLWIYHTHAHIDSFPLCVLLYKPSEEDTSYKTDIALVLDTLEMVLNHHPYVIRVEDANGFHTACYIDSTDRWYKLQIYRHPNFPNPAVVDFYVDGELKGTFTPMNSNYKTNKISFGTTEADSLSDGEVFYDDVSIVDCTDFREQITQINQKEVLSFLVQANNYFSRINPYIIYRNYIYFNLGDLYYMLSLSNLLNSSFNSLSNYERMSYYNELTVKLNQIKLGLLYGDLSEVEKDLVKKSLEFVDKAFHKDYNLTNKEATDEK